MAFLDKLNGASMVKIEVNSHADATRFILCSIEASRQTNETQTDLWKHYESGQLYWTIEHILPQGKNIPAEWVEMIAPGDAKKASELQGEYVHQLGNLTISGYNTTLGNLPFDKKRDRKDNKGNFVGYKNNLYLNRELAHRESWDVGAIEARSVGLVEECLVLFALQTDSTAYLFPFFCFGDKSCDA